jgi:hypothetical protein
MKAHQKCYILAPFTLMVTDFSLLQLPALCEQYFKWMKEVGYTPVIGSHEIAS